MKRKLYLPATCVAAFACLTAWVLAAQGQEPASPLDSTPKAAQQPKTLQGTVFMSAKLTATQSVLKGLLTRDFERIGAAGETLRDVALTTPPTQVRKEFDAEIYDHFRHELLRMSAQLEKMAAEKNLAGAAYIHQNLTSACIACHEYVRDKTLP